MVPRGGARRRDGQQSESVQLVSPIAPSLETGTRLRSLPLSGDTQLTLHSPIHGLDVVGVIHEHPIHEHPRAE
jgi:hypothetical protein